MATVVSDGQVQAQAPSSRRRHATWDAVIIAAIGVALLFAHREALVAMVRLWNNSPVYSYGFTVPLISAYLVWTRRFALAALTPTPAWLAGSAAALLAVCMSLAARAGGIQVLDQLAFLVALVASVLLLFGVAYIRTAWAALAYLLLMIPLWDGLTEPLHVPFQLRSAEIGAGILRLIGIPAYREGTIIALPGLTLEVARACSGVNYLVAVMALGLPLAYLYLPTMWRRALLLASALLVAALSNGLRVALIGLLAHYDIGSPLHGPFHVLHGLFVAGIGYVVLFAGLRWLAPPPASMREAGVGIVRSQSPDRAVRQVGLAHASVPAAGLLVALFVLNGFNVLAREPQSVALRSALSSFPRVLDGWTAMPALPQLDPAAVWPGADSELRRRYRRTDGLEVDLYVGYFASQRQNKELVTFRVTELHNRSAELRVPGPNSMSFYANYAGAEHDGLSRLFWYELDDAVATTRYTVKARTLWSVMWTGHSHGAVVVLTRRAPSSANDADIMLQLAPLVHQALIERLPIGRSSAGR